MRVHTLNTVLNPFFLQFFDRDDSWWKVNIKEASTTKLISFCIFFADIYLNLIFKLYWYFIMKLDPINNQTNLSFFIFNRLFIIITLLFFFFFDNFKNDLKAIIICNTLYFLATSIIHWSKAKLICIKEKEKTHMNYALE